MSTLASRPRRPWPGLIVFLILSFGAATLGSAATQPNLADWYDKLIKPAWNPPKWIFGPVWSLLYLSMAVAAWQIWRQSGVRGAIVPLGLFAIQLALNAAWSWIFFGFHHLGAAVIEILFLWAAILATTIAFWRRSAVAGWLMVPYLAWVTFAAFLTHTIWRLNA